MSRILKFAMVALAAVLAVPAFAQKENPKSNNQDNRGSAPSANAGQAQPAPTAADSTYIIGASDELSISVWNEPNLTLAAVPVRPDGMISLPLINDVQAAGKTPAQLRVEITEKLTKALIKDPHVTVIVTAMNSQRVYVLGQVARAGAYPMFPGMTVLQAISSAGGLILWAKETNIVVLRTENGKQIRLPFNYKDVVNGKNAEQNIVLRAGDTIVV
ncbi:MAG: polysaccharide biosynthesis/export family protein, partial [Candidatus Acidiferrales bacterium]